MLYKTSGEGRLTPSGGSAPATELKPLILLIEDDFALRRSLAEYLVFEGFDVESAADGLEGLRRLNMGSQRRPAVILLDMVMPHMNGLEFCAQHKLSSSSSKIPIIAITGEGLSRYDSAALGLHRAFSKPINLAKLMETIRELAPAQKV